MFSRDAEDGVAFLPSKRLSTIKEDRILNTDRHYSVNEDSDYRDSVEMSDEQASLIRSAMLSHSYTEESYHKYTDTEQTHHVSGPSETAPESEGVPLQSSVLTDLQASLFLPSLLLSGYSSVKQNYDQIVQQSIAQSMFRRSVIGSQSMMVSLIEKLSDDRGASLGLTIANLLPCLLGSSLFTMPFALRGSGYASIVILILLSILANYTAFLLIDTMYEISPRSQKSKRVRGDYVEIAKVAFGDKMARLMNFILVFFLSTSDIVIMILIGNAFYALLALYVPLSKLAFTALCSTLVIPTLFIRRLSHLAYLSMIATFFVVLGGVASTVLFVLNYKSWAANASCMPAFAWEEFALAVSVWLYTLIVHSITPQVEGCMRQPAKMKTAMIVSFVISTAVKISFGIFGALSFGMSTMFLITNNIMVLSHPVGSLINAAVGLYAIAAFPLSFFVVGDTIDAVVLGRNPKKWVQFRKGAKYHFIWVMGSRVTAVGIGMAVAVSIPYFGPVVGILGAILGTLLVFFLPCLFHLKIKWRKLNFYNKAFEILIIILGVTAGCIGLYASIKNLYNAIKA